jgi:tetratricopeptide (TPR) repeat protein
MSLLRFHSRHTLLSVLLAFAASGCGYLPYRPSAPAPQEPPAPPPSSAPSTSGGGATVTPAPDNDATAASVPSTPQERAAQSRGAQSGAQSGRSQSGSVQTASAPSGSAAVSAVPGTPIAIPPAAQNEFDRAVDLMRNGNTVEAELQFQRLAGAYPQLPAPAINLGILHRKAGRLDRAEQALREAVDRNDGSAVAWTELGVVLRMRGQFEEAARAYERAIAADPEFAPAYRNFAVLLDLYLGNPDAALDNFERYKELTGEDKPVSGWIAELRQRTGRRAPPPPPSPQPAEEGDPAPASTDGAPSDGAPPAEEGAPASDSAPAEQPASDMPREEGDPLPDEPAPSEVSQ